MLHSGDGVLPWVTSLLLWVGLGVLVAEWLTSPASADADGGSRRSWVAVQPAAEAVTAASPAASAPPAEPPVEPVDVAGDGDVGLADPPPVPGAPAGAPPLPAEAGPSSPLALTALDVRWTGSQMELTLNAGSERLSYDVREYATVRGYVIDLPGVWSLPDDLRTERTFTRSNLQRLRVGLHRDHLRLVLTLRKYPSAPPRIERHEDGLRVLI